VVETFTKDLGVNNIDMIYDIEYYDIGWMECVTNPLVGKELSFFFLIADTPQILVLSVSECMCPKRP